MLILEEQVQEQEQEFGITDAYINELRKQFEAVETKIERGIPVTDREWHRRQLGLRGDLILEETLLQEAIEELENLQYIHDMTGRDLLHGHGLMTDAEVAESEEFLADLQGEIDDARGEVLQMHVDVSETRSKLLQQPEK